MSLDPLLSASPAIQIHVAGALIALLIGPFALWRKRRDLWHRMIGYTYLTAFLTAALASFFIHGMRLVGPFGPIHLLSLWAIFHIVRGVQQARARQIAAHRATMRGLYFQALGVALIFTFLPGRVMNQLVFPGAPIVGAVVVIATGHVVLGLVYVRPWLIRRFSPSLRKTERI